MMPEVEDDLHSSTSLMSSHVSASSLWRQALASRDKGLLVETSPDPVQILELASHKRKHLANMGGATAHRGSQPALNRTYRPILIIIIMIYGEKWALSF